MRYLGVIAQHLRLLLRFVSCHFGCLFDFLELLCKLKMIGMSSRQRMVMKMDTLTLVLTKHCSPVGNFCISVLQVVKGTKSIRPEGWRKSSNTVPDG